MENLANIGELIGGLAVVLSLLFIAFQLYQARIQMQANALHDRLSMRIEIWKNELDVDALRSAQDKFFEHELYRRDQTFYELDELNLQERRALSTSLLIELAYLQNLQYQRSQKLITHDDSLPLEYMRCFINAPNRRFWKDALRLSDHFPPDFIRHTDKVVKKYDEVERRMDQDEDADYTTIVTEVFNAPPPPRWLD